MNDSPSTAKRAKRTTRLSELQPTVAQATVDAHSENKRPDNNRSENNRSENTGSGNKSTGNRGAGNKGLGNKGLGNEGAGNTGSVITHTAGTGSGVDVRPLATQPASPQVWADEQLAVRIARCYYDLGMTQQQIAQSLDISRARVIRLLAEARQRGIVSITICSPLLDNVYLAEQLADRYALRTAEVCLSHANDQSTLARQIAATAGEAMLRLIRDNTSIGLGWGETLRAVGDQLPPQFFSNVSVVSLLGTFTCRSSATRFEATTSIAAKLNAECLYLPAPIVCDSEHSRELLLAQPQCSDIRQRATQVDLAIVSVGGDDCGTMRQAGFIEEDDYHSALEMGMVGNFLGYCIDGDAEIIDHSINKRVIGVPGDTFKKIPRRLMISAGANKVEAIRATVANGLVTDLVTDESTARALLET